MKFGRLVPSGNGKPVGLLRWYGCHWKPERERVTRIGTITPQIRKTTATGQNQLPTASYSVAGPFVDNNFQRERAVSVNGNR